LPKGEIRTTILSIIYKYSPPSGQKGVAEIAEIAEMSYGGKVTRAIVQNKRKDRCR